MRFVFSCYSDLAFNADCLLDTPSPSAEKSLALTLLWSFVADSGSGLVDWQYNYQNEGQVSCPEETFHMRLTHLSDVDVIGTRRRPDDLLGDVVASHCSLISLTLTSTTEMRAHMDQSPDIQRRQPFCRLGT